MQNVKTVVRRSRTGAVTVTVSASDEDGNRVAWSVVSFTTKGAIAAAKAEALVYVKRALEEAAA